jgi:hypothetical protein
VTIAITQPPAHGTAVVDTEAVDAIGRPGVVYRSSEGYTGPDEFRYTVTDGDGQVSNEATVTFDVVSILTARDDHDPFENEVPVPTNRNVPVVVNVLENDGGLAYAPVQVEILEALNGTATVNADNTVTFTPKSNFTGRWNSPICPPGTCVASGGAYFFYELTDAFGQRDIGAAFIDVYPPAVNDVGDGSSAFGADLLVLLLGALAIRRARRR